MNADGALPFVIKVCGITSATDAMIAAEAGANALGFNFYERSPRAIMPELAAQIACHVPKDILRVGVFVNVPLERILAVAALVRLDVVQLHGERVPSTGYRTWRAIWAGRFAPEGETQPEAYLLDSYSPKYGGSGQTFDWKLAAKQGGRLILAGGLDAQNVARAIEIVQPWGVDACSRLEKSPGKKDVRKVREFVEAAIAGLRSSAG
jgi:phosphoribosylanthranilate isomerase